MTIPRVFTLPRQTAFDTGVIASGAKAYFFKAGTTTPQDTYTTAALTTKHAHPVVADAAGLFPIIYLDDELQYRVQVKDSSDVLIYDEDEINDPNNRAPFYEQTQAEIDAGVTPSDTQYPSGDERRYGAVSGSSSDQSAAIQTAMNIAASSGERGYVDIGRREYTTGTLEWPGSNFELRGNGGKLTAHSSIPSNGALVQFLRDGNQTVLDSVYGAGVFSDSTSTVIGNARIRGIRFVGNSNNIKGIWFVGVASGFIKDCLLMEFGDSCIALNTVYTYTLQGNDCRGKSGAGVGIDIGNSSNSDTTADANALHIIGNHSGTDCATCLVWTTGLGGSIAGNVFESGDVNGPVLQAVEGVTYEGNYHEMQGAGNYGLTVGTSDGVSLCKRIVVTGNHFQMSTDSGGAILINGAQSSWFGPNRTAGPVSHEYVTPSSYGASQFIRNTLLIRDTAGSTYLDESAGATIDTEQNSIIEMDTDPQWRLPAIRATKAFGLGVNPQQMQAHIADASTAHAVSGSGDDATINGALDALGTKLNTVLARLETFGFSDTS